jgi:hypothetical protein
MEYGFDYKKAMGGGTGEWITVVARDTAGNTYKVRNPDFVPPPPYTG